MKPYCRKLRERVATDGPGALRDDPRAQDHVAGCDPCLALLESLGELEAGLAGLGTLDAPDDLVQRLLERPELARPVESAAIAAASESAGPGPGVALPWIRPRRLAWGAALSAALVLGLMATGILRPTRFANAPKAARDLVAREAQEPPSASADEESGAAGRRKSTSRRVPPPTPDEPEAEDRSDAPVPAPGSEAERRGTGTNTTDPAQQGGFITLPGEVQEQALAGNRAPAALTGHVVDRDGNPLPGVTVSAYSERAAMEPVGTVTDADGRYRLDPLRPAWDYELVAELPGFAKVEVSPVELDPGGTLAQNLTLVPSSETTERVTIAAKGDIVGIAGTKTATVFNSEFVEGLPIVGRTYQDILTLAPGVTDVDGKPDASETRSARVPRRADGPARRIETSYVAPVYPEAARQEGGAARAWVQVLVDRDGSVGEALVLRCDRPGLGFEEAAAAAVRQWRYEPLTSEGTPTPGFFTEIVDFVPPGADQGAAPSRHPTDDASARMARAFLAERDALGGLAFRPASGYWANTYLPGDPQVRLLRARIAGWDRSPLRPHAHAGMRLHDASHPAAQPFDAPHGSALAVYLHADRRVLDGRSRLLVQVGLQGTPRHGGRRPAMNLGVVLDLRGAIAPDAALGMRALIDALERAAEAGDRFRLVVAGRPGPVIVEPEDFRHGPLRVTLDRILGGDPPGTGRAPGIVEAVATALEGVAASDDPAAPLGSSALVVITSQALGEATTGLAELAHRSAVGGVPLSVVGVGPGAEPAELDRLALAGHGRRRVLEGPGHAASLVDRELSAASGVVARAVRLRIRLAPGVELVDVLGSRRLDEAGAERVRQAEASIDARVARNLGIQADRGEDEEGVQIVIPAFHAGDSHVVLLDVVAPGPGPIAEVTARYKDLVHLRNSVSRAGLDLAGGESPAGMLELNVLKNLLSLRLSRALDDAGRAVAAGDVRRAQVLLAGFRSLLHGLGRENPGLAGDADVLGDIAMLDEYGALLQDEAVLSAHRDPLSDSLLYAAWLKILSRPLEMES